jgi:hypothetical protein
MFVESFRRVARGLVARRAPTKRRRSDRLTDAARRSLAQPAGDIARIVTIDGTFIAGGRPVVVAGERSTPMLTQPFACALMPSV